MSSDLLSVVHGRRGHFLYESGHHGDMWFDLETLCLRPAALQSHIEQLACLVAKYDPDVICGPLVEGAFIALLVAKQLGCEFVYANRFLPPPTTVAATHTSHDQRTTFHPNGERQTTLFPIRYRIPESLHSAVRGRRVAICNDMINAGSAVRGAYFHLKELGAEVVVVASLMTCGDGFKSFASEHALKVETLVQFSSHLWSPGECPLCVKQQALESLANA